MISRRQLMKYGGLAGGGLVLTRAGWAPNAWAVPAATGLADPAEQPKFVNPVPNALDPSFLYKPRGGKITVGVSPTTQYTGLVMGGSPVPTPLWGYGDRRGPTWPGRTFQVRSGDRLQVTWENNLPISPYLVEGSGGSAVDTSLHWAYALHGYTQYSIEADGVPIVPHVHGGHTDFQYDGNPEFFFSPGWRIRGPQWLTKYYQYFNDQPAGTIWYHDHALGITRLNVYAGMAGFYIVRDEFDTGFPVDDRKNGNTLDLPAFPYEAAFAIQDKMFFDTGELFYPSYPGDPFYADFITDEGAILPTDVFPGGGPTALAEFFGDHMVVNGIIWPKMAVEPRNYRLRLLNGCDSRFLAVQFVKVGLGETNPSGGTGPLPFTVIGSDQGLASSPTSVSTLLMETGSRYDLVFDFKGLEGSRIIMKNIGGDEPFGGDIPGPQVFGETDRIMAFDVELPLDSGVDDVTPNTGYATPIVPGAIDRTRKVALFEGKDEFGRLQPLLGTAEPATDYLGNPVDWPSEPEYTSVGLTGQMEGSIAWHSPTTENPALGHTEEWEIWNMTGDAHPVHLHLVHFEVLGRTEIVFDSDTDEDGFLQSTPADDGVYLVNQPTVQHNSVAGNAATYGIGFRIGHPSNPEDAYGDPVTLGPVDGYVENGPKDMVTALPGQITRIKATFDKPGRYVWHCHILSHEDHEMMRVLHVGPGA